MGDLQLRSRDKLAKEVVRVSRDNVFSRHAARGGAKLAKQQLELTRKQHLTGKVGAACGCCLELLQHAFAAPSRQAGRSCSICREPECAVAARGCGAGQRLPTSYLPQSSSTRNSMSTALLMM